MCRNTSVWRIMIDGRTDAKLAEIGAYSEKRAGLKCQLQFRLKFTSMCPSNNRKFFSYQRKVM